MNANLAVSLYSIVFVCILFGMFIFVLGFELVKNARARRDKRNLDKGLDRLRQEDIDSDRR